MDYPKLRLLTLDSQFQIIFALFFNFRNIVTGGSYSENIKENFQTTPIPVVDEY
jgi:hypothetical protein